MEFNSVEEVIAYIEFAIANAMPSMANEIKTIMDDVTINQITGWTNQMFDSVVPSSSGNMAEASFEDTGHWESWVTGEDVGNPVKFTESGSTKNRPPSTIINTSLEQCEEIIPTKLVEMLKQMGIDIV